MKNNTPADDGEQDMATTPVDEDRVDPPHRPTPAVEIGGRKGPEPTRYGDWEKNGRCIDF